jgi:hypothetical protein
MRNLLRHERYTGYTSFGFGLPPATVIRSKVRASTRRSACAWQQAADRLFGGGGDTLAGIADRRRVRYRGGDRAHLVAQRP